MKQLSEEKYDLEQKPSDEMDKIEKEGSIGVSEDTNTKSEPSGTQEESQQMGEDEMEGREARPSTAVTPEEQQDLEQEDDYDEEPEEPKTAADSAAKVEDEESIKEGEEEDDATRKRKSTVEEQLKLVEKDIFEKGGLVLEEELQDEELEGMETRTVSEIPEEPTTFEISKVIERSIKNLILLAAPLVFFWNETNTKTAKSRKMRFSIHV